MALAWKKYQLEISLADTGANVTTRTYDMTALTYEDALEEGEEAVADYDPITEAVIVGWAIRTVYADAVFTLPADAEIEAQALLDFTIVGNPLKHATMSIPAPANAIMQGTSGTAYNIVDVDSELLLAWWGHFGTGGTLTLPNDVELAVLNSGKRIHRRSSRG